MIYDLSTHQGYEEAIRSLLDRKKITIESLEKNMVGKVAFSKDFYTNYQDQITLKFINKACKLNEYILEHLFSLGLMKPSDYNYNQCKISTWFYKRHILPIHRKLKNEGNFTFTNSESIQVDEEICNEFLEVMSPFAVYGLHHLSKEFLRANIERFKARGHGNFILSIKKFEYAFLKEHIDVDKNVPREIFELYEKEFDEELLAKLQPYYKRNSEESQLVQTIMLSDKSHLDDDGFAIRKRMTEATTYKVYKRIPVAGLSEEYSERLMAYCPDYETEYWTPEELYEELLDEEELELEPIEGWETMLYYDKWMTLESIPYVHDNYRITGWDEKDVLADICFTKETAEDLCKRYGEGSYYCTSERPNADCIDIVNYFKKPR